MPSTGGLDREAMRADTCYHEAAHAVFDYYSGFTVRRVYVTERLNAECVSAVPVEPYPWQAMDLAIGALAGEIAAYRRTGKRMPAVPLDEIVGDEESLEELAEMDGADGDELRALKMLRHAASFGMFGDLEACYAVAREAAEENVDLLWPEIVAVAEGLRETGHLEGAECVRLIESATKGEE